MGSARSKQRFLTVGRLAVATALSLAVAFGALHAGADDAGSTEGLLARLEADPKDKALVQDPAARSRTALERARRMRLAGDEAHAKQADALARQWALVAQELVRAAKEEAQASALRTAALDAGVETERERQLLEQALARTGRLQAELRQAQAEADGGAEPPRAPAPVRDGGTKGNATGTKPAAGDGGARR